MLRRTLLGGAPGSIMVLVLLALWCGVARAERSQPTGVPVRLVLPLIGVDVPVEPLSLSDDLTMPAPQHAGVVGWYTFSAEAGMPGNAVLAGHRDWQRQRGAFFSLGALGEGADIWVQDGSGAWYLYQVIWSASLPEETLLVGDVVGPTDTPSLTLITCSGTFSQTAGQFLERRIVRAELTATIPLREEKRDD